jgi:hypothetical protein
MIWNCPRCGKEFRLPRESWVVKCCGAVTRLGRDKLESQAKEVSDQPKHEFCIHRTTWLNQLDCGCGDGKNLYQCSLLDATCNNHKLSKPWSEVGFKDQPEPIPCNTCDRRQIPGDVIAPLEPCSEFDETEFVCVTSLSLKPNHRQRQPICLNSWRRQGIRIIAVQRGDEIAELARTYPQVDTWVRCDAIANLYPVEKRTQRINRLAEVALEIDLPILLINSDIELIGDMKPFRDALASNAIGIGIRWNFDGDKSKAQREQWGMDAFLLSPNHVATLPQMGYRLGGPFWDYWIPLHCQIRKIPMQFIGSKLLWHQKHDLHWNQDEWNMGARWLEAEYEQSFSNEDSVTWRRSLPFGDKAK